PQDAAAAPADPLDTLREQDGGEPEAPVAANVATHTPATSHEPGPSASGASGPAPADPRDPQ
ncbi:chloride channel protein, partial [Burkholderia diffusa]